MRTESAVISEFDDKIGGEQSWNEHQLLVLQGDVLTVTKGVVTLKMLHYFWKNSGSQQWHHGGFKDMMHSYTLLS